MDRHRDAVPRSGGGAAPDIGALYEKHRDSMRRFAESMLRRDEQHRAEDVVQDAVLSVMRNPPRNVDSWEAVFLQAVKWRVLDLWKSAASKHERLVLDDATPFGDELGGDDLGLDPAIVVEEIQQREDEVARVRSALAELVRTDREAAYVYQQVKERGRTSADVADEMDVSASRVRQLVMRARKKLMEILDTSGGGL